MVMVLEPQHLLRVRLWLCNRSVYDIPSMKCFCKSCIPASLFQNLLVILAMVFVQYFQSRNGDEPLSPSLPLSIYQPVNSMVVISYLWPGNTDPILEMMGIFVPALQNPFTRTISCSSTPLILNLCDYDPTQYLPYFILSLYLITSLSSLDIYGCNYAA